MFCAWGGFTSTRRATARPQSRSLGVTTMWTTMADGHRGPSFPGRPEVVLSPLVPTPLPGGILIEGWLRPAVRVSRVRTCACAACRHVCVRVRGCGTRPHR